MNSVFQTTASREECNCAPPPGRGPAMPPPLLPAVWILGVSAEGGRRGLGLQRPGPPAALVPAGHLLLDSSGGLPPLPASSPSLQHLHQEIRAEALPAGLGWGDGANHLRSMLSASSHEGSNLLLRESYLNSCRCSSFFSAGFPTLTVVICGSFGVYGKNSLTLRGDNNQNSTVQL